MFAWGYPSRQRLDSIRLGGGLRLQADGDSRRLALTSQKYTLKSLILKDTPSGFHNYIIQTSKFLTDHKSWSLKVTELNISNLNANYRMRFFHCSFSFLLYNFLRFNILMQIWQHQCQPFQRKHGLRYSCIPNKQKQASGRPKSCEC